MIKLARLAKFYKEKQKKENMRAKDVLVQKEKLRKFELKAQKTAKSKQVKEEANNAHHNLLNKSSLIERRNANQEMRKLNLSKFGDLTVIEEETPAGDNKQLEQYTKKFKIKAKSQRTAKIQQKGLFQDEELQPQTVKFSNKNQS